ncbi:MAG TPA: UDP-3-O-(3-hydroxymyristoyl)glucosamine N-acyltransferase [Gemmatimonadaceae bacterium]|nr:UDP-3-O-(3-hydroxymyristoyl)glucosamine N-acyltransferase [Gemmatimonadaceae bacterium]
MTDRPAQGGRAGGQSSGGEGGSVLTAAVIAQLTRGELRGDADTVVSSVAPLDRAVAGQLSFCASARYAPQLETTGASVVLVSPDVSATDTRAAARIVVAKPQEALLSLLPKLYVMPARQPGVHATAVIGRGARLGAQVQVGPYVYIGDGAELGDRVTLDAHVAIGAGVRLGDDTHIRSNAVVYSGSELGKRVSIHANAVIGSDGFGYVYADGTHHKIPHVGRCLIGDDVEIGAGSTIDRGSIDDTVIGAGTKIDNLVQIAHNVRVGRLCLIAAQAGIAGSAHLEDGAVLGGQVGIIGHSTIGKGATLAARAGAFGDIPAGETWSGYPARPHRESLRAQAALFKLAGMLKRIEKLLGGEDRP